MTTKLKVVVFCEGDSANVGDRAIYAGLKRQLRAEGADVLGISIDHASSISGDPLTSARAHIAPVARARQSSLQAIRKLVAGLPRFMRTGLRAAAIPVRIAFYTIRIRKLLKAQGPVDLALIGGGGLIMNNGYNFPSYLFAISCEMRRRRVPYFFAGVSCEGHLDWLSRFLFRLSVSRADGIEVRDAASVRLIGSFAPGTRVHLSADFAFLLQEHLPRREPQPGKIAINVTSNAAGLERTEFLEYFDNLIELTKLLHSQGKSITLFTTGWVDDAATLENARISLRGFNSRISYIHPTGPDALQTLLDELSDCEVVYGARLHACILGLQVARAVVPLPYSKKTRAFYEANNISLYPWKDILTPDFNDRLQPEHSIVEAQARRAVETVKRLCTARRHG